MMRTLAAALVATALLAGPTTAQLAPPNDAGVAWGHVHMNVSDLERHTRIWVEHFGGRVVDFDRVRTISLPNTLIMLNERASTGGTVGSSMDHFGFSVPDVDAFLEGWRSDGLDVVNEFMGFGDRPQAYVELPGGIRVELEEVPTQSEPAVPYHVHLYTDEDPEELRDWFVEAFGMAPRVRGNNQFTADVPGMNVSFSPAQEGAPAPSRGRAVDHVGFDIDDLEGFTRTLAERGVIFDVEYRVLEEGLALAFFTDGSGTYWELTQGLARIAGS